MGILENKVAVITGGGTGMGRAIAALFVKEGAKVLIVGRREDKLRESAEATGSPHISYATADVSDAAQTREYISQAVARYGGIDILVNAAGVMGQMNSLLALSEEEFDQTMAINAKGVWLSIKYAVPEMIKRGGGAIVNIASVAGMLGAKNVSAYSASKHAVMGLTRCAALELAAFNIRVNAINPGLFDTDMSASVAERLAPGDQAQFKEEAARQIPMQRYGQAEEVAPLALFLASEASSYISGSAHVIDGAKTAAYIQN